MYYIRTPSPPQVVEAPLKSFLGAECFTVSSLPDFRARQQFHPVCHRCRHMESCLKFLTSKYQRPCEFLYIVRFISGMMILLALKLILM